GNDTYGQLGNGPGDNSAVWVEEVDAALPTLVDVAVGRHHACVLAEGGQVYCWGRNHMGQLGDGTQVDRPSPWLSSVSDATQIAAGGHTTCALHQSGEVSCWGDGSLGQTGDGSYIRFDASPVVGMDAACEPGTWDLDGDLSNGCELTCEPTGPETCNGLDDDCDGEVDEDFDTATDPNHCGACGAACAGAGAESWGCEASVCVVATCAEGLWDTDGDPGNGCEYTCTPTGVDPKDQGEICNDQDDDCDGETDEGSGAHLCGDSVTNTGEVGACVDGACEAAPCPAGSWNLDQSGTCEYACEKTSETDGCGDGDEDCDGEEDEDGADCAPPTTKVTQLSVGFSHACALRADETLWCWGDGTYGKMGLGTTTSQPLPVQVPLDAPVKTVAAEGHSTCAITLDGKLWCWGFGTYGQLGLPAGPVLAPTLVESLSDVAAMKTNTYHGCALLEDGTARCMGSQSDGALGDGVMEATVQHIPQTVVVDEGGEALSEIEDICVGIYHSCALMKDTTVRCWGESGTALLGDGTATDAPYPVQVLNFVGDGPLTGAVQLDCKHQHSCALLEDGTAMCWGPDQYGTLGGGSTLHRQMVVKNSFGSLLSGIEQITTGHDHTCARTESGDIWCWGDGEWGDLGALEVPKFGFPQKVEGLASVADLMATTNVTGALMEDGTVRMWGKNHGGLLGQGTLGDNKENTPQAVKNLTG
ncbi:MAG: hypothetical protein VX938_07990, partial [Myxococcota bacterium]|nr:hypothetical protein [Myxococcota bacterium]